MKHLQKATLLATVLTTGLMAGLFAAFAYAVMPGLGLASDRTLVDAMQGIDKAIYNPLFMLPYMGSVPLLVLAVVLARRGRGRAALPWLIAALVLYVAAIGVTVAGNLPLNDQIKQVGDPDRVKDLAAVRADFEDAWVAWNIVRTVLHTVAFGLVAWGTIVYGAHRVAGDAAASRAGSGPASAGRAAAGWQQPQAAPQAQPGPRWQGRPPQSPAGSGPRWQPQAPQAPQAAPQAQPGPRWERRVEPAARPQPAAPAASPPPTTYR